MKNDYVLDIKLNNELPTISKKLHKSLHEAYKEIMILDAVIGAVSDKLTKEKPYIINTQYGSVSLIDTDNGFIGRLLK